MQILDVLITLHNLLEPRSYLQLGLNRPELISLGRYGTVGIAPAPRVDDGAHSSKPWLELYAVERDAFFEAERQEHVPDGGPLDLVVIEGGLPLSRLAGDLDNIARWAHSSTPIVVPTENRREGDLARLDNLVRSHWPEPYVDLATAASAPLLA